MIQPAKPFTAQELEELAERTLAHYCERAEDFREGTRDHDVSQVPWLRESQRCQGAPRG